MDCFPCQVILWGLAFSHSILEYDFLFIYLSKIEWFLLLFLGFIIQNVVVFLLLLSFYELNWLFRFSGDMIFFWIGVDALEPLINLLQQRVLLSRVGLACRLDENENQVISDWLRGSNNGCFICLVNPRNYICSQ